MKKIAINIIVMSFLLFFYSCNGKKVESPIPNIPFDITINLSLPLYSDLLHPMSGVVFVNGGSKGLAVLRTGPEQFAIFDRHCPYKMEEQCVITTDSDGIAILIDETCCSSKFNMLNEGLPENGPAVTALKPYNYTFNGSILRIYN